MLVLNVTHSSKKMAGTENIQALPIWVWLSFAIITVGMISLIYSQGKWRPTLMLMGVALLAVFFAKEISHFQTYLNTHFIGSYDHLGIPFLQSPPGWSLILAAWPLWLLPIIVVSILTWIVCVIWQSYAPKKSLEIDEATIPIAPNIKEKLDVATFKQDLITALHTIDKQAIDNQALEFKVRQLTKAQQEAVAYLEDKVKALNLEIEAQEAQKQQIMNARLQQAEEIVNLKNKLTALQKRN